MLRTMLLPCLAAAAAAAEPVTVATGLQKPESVAQDPDTGALYVSNIGEGGDDAPLAKDGNGFISKLNADGSIAELRFLPKEGEPKLNAPKGMAIEGSVLFVADIDRVVSFDVETGKQIMEFPLTAQKVAFANDLCIIDDTLLLSDTGTDQVLMLESDGHGGIKTAEPIGEAKFGGANGIAGGPGKKWYLASFPLKDLAKGEAYVHEFTIGVDVSDNRKLPFPSGAWDGIAVAADGTVYASDWRSGGVWALPKGAAAATQLTKLMQGPADFCLLKDGSALLVPEMLANRISRVDLK